jgi:hypothetical protein
MYISFAFRLHDHENHGLKMLFVGLKICVQTTPWPMCTSFVFAFARPRKPWFEDVVRWFEDLCENHSSANVHFIRFSFARPRKPWFENVVRWFEDFGENHSVANVHFIRFRVHEHENNGLKMLFVL